MALKLTYPGFPRDCGRLALPRPASALFASHVHNQLDRFVET